MSSSIKRSASPTGELEYSIDSRSLYASLAHSLRTEVLDIPDPNAHDAFRLLEEVRGLSAGPDHPITKEILEATDLANVVAEVLALCRKHEWVGAASVAQVLTNLFVKKARKRSMWRCDVCKVRRFADKAEALAHEAECPGLSARKSPVPSSRTTTRKAKEEALEEEGPNHNHNDYSKYYPGARKARKWRCDVCKARRFEDKDEAMAHEAQCEAPTGSVKEVKVAVKNSPGAGADEDGDGAAKSNSEGSNGSGSVMPFLAKRNSTSDGGSSGGTMPFLDLTQDDDGEESAGQNAANNEVTEGATPNNVTQDEHFAINEGKFNEDRDGSPTSSVTTPETSSPDVDAGPMENLLTAHPPDFMALPMDLGSGSSKKRKADARANSPLRARGGGNAMGGPSGAIDQARKSDGGSTTSPSGQVAPIDKEDADSNDVGKESENAGLDLAARHATWKDWAELDDELFDADNEAERTTGNSGGSEVKKVSQKDPPTSATPPASPKRILPPSLSLSPARPSKCDRCGHRNGAGARRCSKCRGCSDELKVKMSKSAQSRRKRAKTEGSSLLDDRFHWNCSPAKTAAALDGDDEESEDGGADSGLDGASGDSNRSDLDSTPKRKGSVRKSEKGRSPIAAAAISALMSSSDDESPVNNDSESKMTSDGGPRVDAFGHQSRLGKRTSPMAVDSVEKQNQPPGKRRGSLNPIARAAMAALESSSSSEDVDDTSVGDNVNDSRQLASSKAHFNSGEGARDAAESSQQKVSVGTAATSTDLIEAIAALETPDGDVLPTHGKSHQGQTPLSGFPSASESTSPLISSGAKIPANPLVGATVYVCHGANRGHKGKLIMTEVRGVWTINNALASKRVHCRFCKLIDDGNADIDAIKKWYERRGTLNRMPPVIKTEHECNEAEIARDTIGMGTVATPSDLIEALLTMDDSALSSADDDLKQKIFLRFQKILNPIECPAGYDPETFNALPREMQQELCNSNPEEILREEKRAKSTVTKPRGEARRLQNHLISGLHDIAPNHAASLAARNGNSLAVESENSSLAGEPEISRPRRLARIDGDVVVDMRHWNDSSGELITDRPIHYGVVPKHIETISDELKGEILALFRGREDKCIQVKGTGRISKPQQVHRGYFKAHIVGGVGDQLRAMNVLPGHLEVKEKAVQQLIMFVNTEEGICECHYDRDSSALYVVSGFKTVMIAPPVPEAERPWDGILADINPFSKKTKHRGNHRWQRIEMVPGDVLYIPKFWLHCIKSVGSPNTVALSFQVAQSSSPNTSQKVWEPTVLAVPPPLPARAAYRRPSSVEDEESFSGIAARNSLLIKSEKLASIAQVAAKPEPPRRTSGRQKYNCGVCSRNGFNGEEMWILQWTKKTAVPIGLPYSPVSIPKHLVCFNCCPRSRGGDSRTIRPSEEILFPHGGMSPILTAGEFAKQGEIDRRFYSNYTYRCGSEIDYKSAIVNEGAAINDLLEGQTDRIKSELVKSEESSL